MLKNIQSFLQFLQLKRIARQLQKPSGKNGLKTGVMMQHSNAAQYAATIEIMQLSANDSLLEIGFGNGYFFKDILEKAANLQVYGIDHSSILYKDASLTNANYIQSGKLELHNGKCDKLPFQDNFFEKVMLVNVIYFWEKPVAQLKEIERVLKPGGKLYVTIRSKETMKNLPFTKFGFQLYDKQRWLYVLKSTNFQHVAAIKITEPDFKHKEQAITMDSICFVAEKQV